MAKKKKARAKRKNNWTDQAAIVYKSHPFAKTQADAEKIAKKHVRGEKVAFTVEFPRSWRVVFRPKECCQAKTFRGKAHGAKGKFVTVVSCKVAKGAARRKVCR